MLTSIVQIPAVFGEAIIIYYTFDLNYKNLKMMVSVIMHFA